MQRLPGPYPGFFWAYPFSAGRVASPPYRSKLGGLEHALNGPNGAEGVESQRFGIAKRSFSF